MANTGLNELKRQKALDMIFEHSRDYFKLKMDIPLGDTALKNVHTNQFLFTALPKDFQLQNWKKIAQAFSSKYTRYSSADYDINRFYIEGNTIDVNIDGTAKMSLDLNAFASSNSKFTEIYTSLVDAYKKEKEQKETGTKTTSSSKSTTNATKTNNTTVKNGWWGKWVTDLVKKNVGNETNTLKKCKIMYQVFHDHARYAYYYNMKHTSGSPSKLEKVWKNGTHLNCGDGANFLSAFYSCCGATSGIYLTYDAAHYIVKCTVNGKSYWTDQSGAVGARNTRGWNQTWHGYRSGNYKGKYV